MQAMKLLVSIVQRGDGVGMQRLYADYHVFLHMQFPARGTATSEIMDILGLGSSEKDVVISFVTANTSKALLCALDDNLHRELETTGIVFDLPLQALNHMPAALLDFKSGQHVCSEGGERHMEQMADHVLILASCCRGYADAVMATARALGARGGTVVKSRMAGLEDLEQAYSLNLKEERELILIVISKDARNEIMEGINNAHGMKTPSQCIVCTLPVDHMVRL